MIQPFEKIDGMTYTKYLARFVSDSGEHLDDRDRYEVMVKLDPWDKLEEFSCECKGFLYGKGKRRCKHIKETLEVLREWKEIQEVPGVEDKDGIKVYKNGILIKDVGECEITHTEPIKVEFPKEVEDE